MHRRHKSYLWRAEITIKGKTRHVGCFATQEEASRAYDDKAREVYGDNAIPNFFLDGTRNLEVRGTMQLANADCEDGGSTTDEGVHPHKATEGLATERVAHVLWACCRGGTCERGLTADLPSPCFCWLVQESGTTSVSGTGNNHGAPRSR